MDIIPHNFIYNMSQKLIEFDVNLMKCVLCYDSFNEDNLRDIQSYGDVSGVEITSGNGYNIGGIDVSGTSAYIDNTNNRIIFKCDDLYFPALSGNVGPSRFAVMYDSEGNDTAIYVFDFGENKTINDGSNMRIRVDSTGFIKARQAT